MHTMRSLRLQPDYYFGTPQFAGVAIALSNQLYRYAGIDLTVLTLGDAGAHASETRVVEACNDGGMLTVATTEQNILVPAIRSGLRLKAVAAMFGSSPLGIATLPGRENCLVKIGVHDDTVELTQRLFPNSQVLSFRGE